MMPAYNLLVWLLIPLLAVGSALCPCAPVSGEESAESMGIHGHAHHAADADADGAHASAKHPDCDAPCHSLSAAQSGVGPVVVPEGSAEPDPISIADAVVRVFRAPGAATPWAAALTRASPRLADTPIRRHDCLIA
jgi:hypothetical protein